MIHYMSILSPTGSSQTFRMNRETGYFTRFLGPDQYISDSMTSRNDLNGSAQLITELKALMEI